MVDPEWLPGTSLCASAFAKGPQIPEPTGVTVSEYSSTTANHSYSSPEKEAVTSQITSSSQEEYTKSIGSILQSRPSVQTLFTSVNDCEFDAETRSSDSQTGTPKPWLSFLRMVLAAAVPFQRLLGDSVASLLHVVPSARARTALWCQALDDPGLRIIAAVKQTTRPWAAAPIDHLAR